MRSWTPLLLVLLAALHCVLAVSEGLENGDFSLLYVAAPFVGLTLLAAAGTVVARPWARYGAFFAAALTLVMAFLLVSAYGLGLFHLPQAALATVLTVRAAARS